MRHGSIGKHIMSIRHLEHLFRPASIAVIGASDKPGRIGTVVWRNLRDGGFHGPVWAVNKRPNAAGVNTWRDVVSLPQVPDLAVICTPAATVPGLIEQLGHKGTRAAIVISSGLKQCTSPGGATLEQQMLDAARPHLLRVLGPNCIGLLVPQLGLNASFAPGNAREGKLAFVTQSGALATAMLDWANARSIGFSHFISLGDSADVDFGDVLDYLGSDAGTRAILMYAEAVKHGRKFMSAARAAARNKPVIIVKAGRAPEGALAAASHTGALAGSDIVFDAAVRRAGMLRVPTLEALFDAAATLAHPWPYRGERLAVMTNGGGAGVLAADALSAGGGQLASLSAATLAALDACLPATWSHGDPIDIIGDAPSRRYADALEVLLAAPEVQGILFAHAPTAVVPAAEIAQACLASVKNAGKPVLGCWLGGASVQPARDAWSQAGIPSFDTPERAADAWLQIVTHARNQETLQQIPPAAPEDAAMDRALAQSLIDETAESEREWLDEVRAKALLQACGIPVVPTRKAHNAEEAAHIAAEIGFPVAIKIITAEALHKSDVGGVALNLQNEHEVRNAAMRMRQDLARLRPEAHVLGFAVEAMVKRPGGREVIVGVSNDPVFGPVILCGLGGTDVELTHRHAVALPPLNALLADDLIARAGLKPLFAASRGRRAIDEAAVRDVLLKISRMLCELQGIAELDINPLVVDAHGVVALDARVRIALPGGPALAPLAIRPYPAQLEERLRIGDVQLDVRPIRPEDAPRLQAFYANASPEDMRLRFFFVRREVPRSELARYTQIDYDREMTFIALAPDGSMAGEVRALCDPDNERAEFAVQVAGAWQGKGLGTALLRKMLGHLRERGTKELFGMCLPENHAMAALARELGMEVHAEADATTLRLRLASSAGQSSGAVGATSTQPSGQTVTYG
jgi:acetyltransferase